MADSCHVQMSETGKLTHLDVRGEARMVDVGSKPETRRTAIAEGRIRMEASTLELVRSNGHKKGDVLNIARTAGIMAAKRTWELIPLCHPLKLDFVELQLDLEDNGVYCRARVQAHDRTGVEMEALTAVQAALLTVYDMCKAVDRGMTMEDIRLLEKAGGRSGHYRR